MKNTISNKLYRLLTGFHKDEKNCEKFVMLAEKSFENVTEVTIKHGLCAKNVFTVYNSDTNELEDFSVVDNNTTAVITLVNPKNITVKYFKEF